jgi:hypothetical protein
VVVEVKRRPQSTTGTKMMHGSHIHQWVPVEEQLTGAEEKENENKSGSDRGPIQDLFVRHTHLVGQRITEVI